MPRLLVDADACPVKEQIFNICFKFKLETVLVANTYFRIPQSPFLKFKLVSKDFDAADDWIAENTDISTIVITSDILLAERCLSLGDFGGNITFWKTVFDTEYRNIHLRSRNKG